ncbi:hypothetical protein KAFR_0B00860 [Kazachstania africana CBS 2517]|uniref:Adenylate kinase isoenzyme 6 homolog n=1 Tax=Kazachstania africana (strain ATCC 22294 / BCRC 22015 / CBS 2517 / CECT 1963 / NBRC 1671 / NRRL Y-8276) TaxID=1071382 RepID=H2APT4_KAZAF|nr:hypothetical protein KAFR_0B00860 [Kazachstania africana CBS 2517]CCF56384.1 hypothetical protein KAFR_0B00860 [Kazachstania africana CBS 2517]
MVTETKESRRYSPNLLVTGTPGCGKSTTCELLMRRLPDYTYFNISEFAEKHKCYDGYDESRKSHIVDDDKLLDELEPLLRRGKSIIDWHVNDVFPERLIDLVVVLRCDNSILFDRLHGRGYHESKIQENLDAEIMGVVLQDALDSYEQEIVVELQSNSTEEMDANVERIVAWQEMWLTQHKNGVTNEYQGELPKDSNSDEEQQEESSASSDESSSDESETAEEDAGSN